MPSGQMKKKYSAFDIIGPVMVGPSSSHTAGAARLGKIARGLAEEEPVAVTFTLHGSFSKTYKGHGTDRALVAGILGMDPDDDRLKDSLKLAKEKGIIIVFQAGNLGDVHPNTVRIDMTMRDGRTASITGSSIGGGAVEVMRIDGDEVSFSGNYPTLLVTHRDTPGVVAAVTRILYKSGINIAFMSVVRSQRGREATMIFETDSNIPKDVLEALKAAGSVEQIRFIPLGEDPVSYPVTT